MPRSVIVRASLPLAAALLAGASTLGAQGAARSADAAFLRQLYAAGALRLVAPLAPADAAALAAPTGEAPADPARSVGSRLLGDILWVAGGSAALVTSVVLASPGDDGAKPAAIVTRPPDGDPPPTAPGPDGGSGLDKPAAPAAPPPGGPTMHVAPEPGTVLLVATGLAGVAVAARRWRAR